MAKTIPFSRALNYQANRYKRSGRAAGAVPVWPVASNLSLDINDTDFLAPSAGYDVCEQKRHGGESGYAHSISPVPNPIYPLPIGSTFCHATSEWNQEKD